MRQRVDPFIPVTRRSGHTSPLPSLVNNVPRVKQPPAAGSMSVRPVRPVIPIQNAPKQHAVHARPRPAKQQPSARSRRTWKRLQLPAFIVGAVLAGFLIQSAAVGEICIAVYGIVAFVRRVPSRTTFTLALLVFAGIITLLLFQANDTLAANFATYAFLLLAVGAITLGRELHEQR